MARIVPLVALVGLLVALAPVSDARPGDAQQFDELDAAREAVLVARSDAVMAALAAGDRALLSSAYGEPALSSLGDGAAPLAASAAGQMAMIPRVHELEYVRVEPLGPERVRVDTRERVVFHMAQTDGSRPLATGLPPLLHEACYIVRHGEVGWRVVQAVQPHGECVFAADSAELVGAE